MPGADDDAVRAIYDDLDHLVIIPTGPGLPVRRRSTRSYVIWILADASDHPERDPPLGVSASEHAESVERPSIRGYRWRLPSCFRLARGLSFASRRFARRSSWIEDGEGRSLSPADPSSTGPLARVLELVAGDMDPSEVILCARLLTGDRYEVGSGPNLVGVAEAAAGIPARPRTRESA